MSRTTRTDDWITSWPADHDALADLRRRGDVEFLAASPAAGRPGRARVLVEHTDGAVRYAVEHALAERGCDVAGCGGPSVFRDARCPLIASGRCPLVDGADVLLHALNPSHGMNARVLEEVKAHHPETPVVVEVPAPVVDQHAELLAGCHVIEFPMTRERLVSAIRAARAERG